MTGDDEKPAQAAITGLPRRSRLASLSSPEVAG
jgi:hypothetical protein